jgi:Protein of unknown function (DUF3106)
LSLTSPLRFLAGLAAALCCFAALAQVPVLAGKSWAALSAHQRQLLAPLEQQWPQMDAAAQDRWVAVAKRYPLLDEAEQQRFRERLAQWAVLSTAERERVHQGYMAAQRIDAAARQEKWQEYKALEPAARQALQDRAARRSAQASGHSSQPMSQTLASDHAGSRPLKGASAQLDPNTLLPLRGPSSTAP